MKLTANRVKLIRAAVSIVLEYLHTNELGFMPRDYLWRKATTWAKVVDTDAYGIAAMVLSGEYEHPVLRAEIEEHVNFYFVPEVVSI